jgi:hypothetical protein
MKTKTGLILIILIPNFIFAQAYSPEDQKSKDGEYIVIGWNDLGMHCANKDFQNICVLPPYNNVTAQVIKKGSATTLPEVITTGVSVSYEIPGNTYSVGKTNFWSYEDQIFGVNLPDNIGLAGAGLSGQMQQQTDHFKIIGIPITPYTDANLITEDPYQLALLKLYDNTNNLLATTQPVVPVSNEINCVSSGCHSSETSILNQHPAEGGFNPNNTPILCASCHSSNALGTPGMPGVPSLSFMIHDKHKDKTNDCYKCHPGPNTQCHRDVMHTLGMVCQDCHGDLAQVASSIENGRQPWLQEPSCGAVSCHGANYAEEPGKLFRNSKGHGGLYCSACHGSPHAILPTSNARDNVQNIALQGFEGTLRRCELCHGVIPASAGPHGIMPPSPVTQTNIKVFLEGPFNGVQMNNNLIADAVLPLNQPYNTAPWNYNGTENVTIFPSTDIVDWVLIELRESNGDASSATQENVISRRAAFLMKDGTVRDLDGISYLQFPVPSYTNLYTVMHHRNHLAIMNSFPLTKVTNYYSYDFSTGPEKVLGGMAGYSQLTNNIYGMSSGDGNADRIINLTDKTSFWSPQSGHKGYLNGDFNLNIQVDNKDKNHYWKPNLGKGSAIP